MEAVEIRPMQVSHLPEILTIEREVFPSPWTEGMFRQELSRIYVSRLYVALLGDRVVGYELAWFIEDVVHLINIAVAKSYQHRRIGTKLLKHLQEEAVEENKRYITLEVRRSNETAQEFYKAFCFDVAGVRKKYYSDNHEDAVLMILDLGKQTPRDWSITEQAGFSREHPLGTANLAVLLGSGLGGACREFSVEASLSFGDVPGLTPAGVPGHCGEFRRCRVFQKSCLFILGRKHHYEGADDEIRTLIGFIAAAGVRDLIVTSAAGSLDGRLCPGELVLIDHAVDLQSRKTRFGTEATGMGERQREIQGTSGRRARSRVRKASPSSAERGGRSGALHLNRSLLRRLEGAAVAAGVPVKRGTLACLAGPAYETPAEVRALREIGADVATMSAAPEIFFANLMGVNVATMCLVTNFATGLSPSPPNHSKVLEVSERAAAALGNLLVELIKES